MERSEMKIRVLLCDDTPEVLVLLRVELGLHEDLEVVGTASDGAQAIAQAGALQPEVVVLDLAMPVMDGLEAIPHLRRVSPETKIVVLSAFQGLQMARQALELGAERYIEKGADPWTIVDAIRDVASRATTRPVT
jgi:DNA-binding NarL/FixJ family response regulator